MPNRYHADNEKSKRCDELLTEIEKTLKTFIQEKGLLPYLIENHGAVKFQGKGIEEYDFERNYKDWPGRSIRWEAQDGLYYLIDIWAADDMEAFNVWMIVCIQPFGFPEPGTFQQQTTIRLPMGENDIRQLLEESYQFLCEKGTEIKRIMS